MNSYIEKEGNRKKVIEEIMQACSLSVEDSKGCLDFLEHNCQILSDDELLQYCNTGEHAIEGVSEFVSEDGQIYISVKRETIFLVALFLGLKIPALGIGMEIAKSFGLCEIKNGFVRIKDETMRCLLLELVRSGKQGIDRNVLAKYKGECCNNYLGCKYKHDGFCNCKEKDVEEICDGFIKMGLAEKKGGKFFYAK